MAFKPPVSKVSVIIEYDPPVPPGVAAKSCVPVKLKVLIRL